MTKTLDELCALAFEIADRSKLIGRQEGLFNGKGPWPEQEYRTRVSFEESNYHDREKLRSALRELIADAERWEKRARDQGWKEPDPFAMWYMHDNHLFTKLPLELEPAMTVLRAAFDGECGHYGMLCSKHYRETCHSRADWESFEPKARVWITAAIDAQRTKASE